MANPPGRPKSWPGRPITIRDRSLITGGGGGERGYKMGEGGQEKFCPCKKGGGAGKRLSHAGRGHKMF